jgi:hypothetical protein
LSKYPEVVQYRPPPPIRLPEQDDDEPS